MGEFEFIADHLVALAGPEALDLKDDVALWSAPDGQDVVMSMDTLVEGVHFPSGQFDAQLAQKLLRVNVSDIAAKGALPVGYLLSLCLPKFIDEPALGAFCEGLAHDQAKYGMSLWGGDTTRTLSNTCVLSLTIMATVPRGQAVRRSTACVGDVVCVTGTIGDAYLGLQVVQGTLGENAYLRTAYNLPNPPYDLCSDIRKYGSAALDISDGLIADAGHMSKASGVSLHLDLNALPLSMAAKIWLEAQEDQIQARIALATGGDDYQTLMSMSIRAYKQALNAGMPFTKIGSVVEGAGVISHNGQGQSLLIEKSGYRHF